MARIKDLKRMCRGHEECNDCPLYIDGFAHCAPGDDLPDNADEIVDKWVQEHPVKTYAMDFFEKFPNAPSASNGTPQACLRYIYGDRNNCDSCSCTECWKSEMKE